MGLTIPAIHLRTVLDTAVERGASAAELCRAVSLDEGTSGKRSRISRA